MSLSRISGETELADCGAGILFAKDSALLRVSPVRIAFMTGRLGCGGLNIDPYAPGWGTKVSFSQKCGFSFLRYESAFQRNHCERCEA
jgi:hypothetical protein